jgi:iron-sulfur cluster assembly protein
MDPKAKALLEGITLDYQKQGLNEGFEFINPLEKARCGCGKTFSI